jgi:hypothetical protein
MDSVVEKTIFQLFKIQKTIGINIVSKTKDMNINSSGLVVLLYLYIYIKVNKKLLDICLFFTKKIFFLFFNIISDHTRIRIINMVRDHALIVEDLYKIYESNQE